MKFQNLSERSHIIIGFTTITISESRTENIRKSGNAWCIRLNKIRNYKGQVHQALSHHNDRQRRLTFRQSMVEKLERNSDYMKIICFTDECRFWVNGSMSSHFYRYWCARNPHVVREQNHQNKDKVNVWAGIYRERIIGPIFIEGNLNPETYFESLEDEILPALLEVVGDDSEIFQHDGAPAHSSRMVTQLLNDIFGDNWIGLRAPTEWPPRSRDLTPLDFFLWGYLKMKVFNGRRIENTEHLKTLIREECAAIPPDMLRNTQQNFVRRIRMQCEHLLTKWRRWFGHFGA